jgi:hypothetical protein
LRQILDVDLLGNFDRVIDLDAEIADSALNLRMSEQQLDYSRVACSAIDEHGFGSAQRVGAELGWIKPDAADPFMDQSGILPGGHYTHAITAAGGQELTGLSAGQSQIFVDRLSRLIGQFEPDGSTGLLLPHRRAIHRITAGCNIIDPNSDDVTAAQFAVDSEVEESKISFPVFH